MRHPKTPDQLAAEREDADRLAALLWPGGWRCGHCGGDRHGRLARRPRVFVCRRCHRQRSVTSDTILENTRSIRRWFHAADVMTRPGGCSASRFAAEHRCGWETAWETMQRLRAAIPVPTDEEMGERLEMRSWGILVRRPPGVGQRRFPTDEPCLATVMAMKSERDIYKIDAYGDQQRIRRLQRTGRLPLKQQPLLGIEIGRLDRWLRETHHTVSHRWLLRYGREYTWRRMGRSADDLTRVALAARAARFEALKPPFKGDLRFVSSIIVAALAGRCAWYRPKPPRSPPGTGGDASSSPAPPDATRTR